MKFKFARKIFSPPVFEDEEKTRVARLFNGIAIAGFFILVSMIVIRIATGTMNILQFWVAFSTASAHAALLIMMRRGFVRVSCLLYSVLLFIGVSFAVYINGGASTSITSYYILCIATASLLVGNRAGIITMIFSIIAVFGFVQANFANLIPFSKMESDIAHWLVYSTVFIGVGFIQMMAVGSIKRSLEDAQQSERKLMLSNQDLEHFAYISTHDLQEPLRKIQAFGDRLKAGYEDKLDERGLDYLFRMQDASRRSQILVQDLLVYSRISMKDDDFESVNLNKITKLVLEEFQDRIKDSGALITIGNLSTVYANPAQMHKLLHHLIDNAIKFQSPNKTLEIKINTEENHQNQIVLMVSDNGIGIEEQYLEKIFQPFQRLHGHQEYPGSGIGLAICQKIVVHHGGSITTVSTPGLGSTFSISLPTL